ncbi:DUF7373 family lipoprotein [Nocardia jiangsuensis]|uniref:Uncharacterized protein n=1 Tax=Nocardia jiangsuensis TaxID=1691563 RepID=A0ABV8DX71_9NOCA
MSRIALCLSTMTVAGLLAGCSIPGAPVAGEPDVRKLEVGKYEVDRHSYDVSPAGHGAVLEGIRMADAVVPSIDIDPSLSHGRTSSVLTTVDDTIGLLADVSRPVLENRKFLTGYVAAGADRADPKGETLPVSDATAVTTVVLRFPDQGAAAAAAKELEDADINVAPENQKLSSTKFSDAYLHWRPGVPSVGAFLAHGEFVISLYVQRPKADSADLVSWVDKALTAEVPVLDSFRPTPTAEFDDLPVDPEGMLARVVVESRADRTPDPQRFAVYGPGRMLQAADDQAARQQLIQETGLDSSAVVDNTLLHRLRDTDAARTFMTGLIDSAGAEYDPIGAPNDVPGAKCLRLNAAGDRETEYAFSCFVTYKRYVAVVSSDLEPDVRQKVAAQYALLANSL